MKLAILVAVLVMGLAVSARHHKRPKGSHEAYRPRPPPDSQEELFGKRPDGHAPSLLQLLWLPFLAQQLNGKVPIESPTTPVPMTEATTTTATTTTTTTPATTTTPSTTTSAVTETAIPDFSTSAIFSINISNILTDIFGLSNRQYVEDASE